MLVIDDDPGVLALIGSLLEAAGFEVTSLSDLPRARRALSKQPFQLVLCDLYLEDDHLGFELADAAAAMGPPVPVVLVTGRPSFARAQDAIRSRVAEIVLKPIDGPELVEACRRAIESAQIRRRNEALEAQNRILAQVLPRAIEVKDPTTKGHADRVVRYADVLAVRCGVDAEEREGLRMAALLHDVGKIGIPLQILCKEGPLSGPERETIKKHPGLGHEILEPLQYSEQVRTWVVQHHERWDGKGYPNGIGGEEVALPGRILVLAEVYDALAEARSYKPAWPLRRITAYFREQAGHHFDPDLAHLVASGLEQSGRRFLAAAPGRLF